MSDLVLKYIPSERFYQKARFQLERNFYYSVKGKQIKIPRDFRSDGATIPRAFWPIFPLWGKYGKAAVIHDYYCAIRTTSKERKSADLLFKEILIQEGIHRGVAQVLYLSVRAFGVTLDAGYLQLKKKGYL